MMEPLKIEMFWEISKLQITPFNSMLVIPGAYFKLMCATDLAYLLSEMSKLTEGPFAFVRDSLEDRVFLGAEKLFPEGSLLRLPTEIPILVNTAGFVGQAVHSHYSNNASPESATSPSSTETSVDKKEKIARPLNAFILYRKDHHEAIKAENPGIHNNQISIILGRQWQNEARDVVASYRDLAKNIKAEHARMYPDYQYRPRKSTEKKRRLTKRKIEAALAATQNAITANVSVATPSPVGLDDSDAQSLHAVDSGTAPNFRDFGGAWDRVREGQLPMTETMASLIVNHNESQVSSAGDVPVLPAIPGAFETSPSFNAEHNLDLTTIDWEALNLEFGYPVLGDINFNL